MNLIKMALHMLIICKRSLRKDIPLEVDTLMVVVALSAKYKTYYFYVSPRQKLIYFYHS